MVRLGRKDDRTALPFIAPFLIIFVALFLYPTVQMLGVSLTDAHLIAAGEWVGLDNYLRLFRDWRFHTAVLNTAYFAALTVLPSTLLGLLIAMMIQRLDGWPRAFVLAVFFVPYILPVSTVTSIWYWLLDRQSGVLQVPIEWLTGHRINIFRTVPLVLPVVAILTVWWTTGFNILLYVAGLRTISPDLYEAASVDGVGRWHQFRHITWPLVWPVTVLVFTLQLILQLKVFDQVYLLVSGGRVDSTLVLVQYIYSLAFQRDQAGYASAVAIALFLVVVAVVALQYRLLAARSKA
jgi:multiple sugar transport system permease protein